MTSGIRLAIFVGGRSTRMGTPKGLLATPGGGPPILSRLIALGHEEGLRPFLVGDASAYAALPSTATITHVSDDPRDAGPLGGLRAALRFVQQQGIEHVASVACDMPFVTAEALCALCQQDSAAPVVAPRLGDEAPWEPMFARYHAASVLPVLDEVLAARGRSFQRLLACLAVQPLEVTAPVRRALDDWDSPADVVP